MTVHSPSMPVAPRLLPLLLAGVLAGCGSEPPPPAAAEPGAHADLVALFGEWREFERPEFHDGIPDYTAAAMARQHAELPAWRTRLDALAPESWPVPEQIDWHLLRAEMNGLDFDHRVRRPWARDPGFYVQVFTAQSDVPAHEGPVMHGFIDLWTYDYPLSEADAAELAARIGTVPGVLAQAKENLAASNARDLWLGGFRYFRNQAADLTAFGERVGGTSGGLDAAVEAAHAATIDFGEFLEAEAGSKTGPSGVGAANYTWAMRHVHLLPWSWEQIVTLMERELARSHSSMRLEENRNRALPELERIASAGEFDRRLNESVDRYLEFLVREEVQSIEDYMDPALRAVNGTFQPLGNPEDLRNFFSEVNYRDPDAFRPHMHHWIELATMRDAPHLSAIRAVPSLFNIYAFRSEGLATGVEEMFMHLGLLEGSPRSRELTWIMLAQRAARAISGLHLHGGGFDMEEAVAYAMKWTPRGWLTEGALVRGEQSLYLRQPGYGTSYVIGKIQIEQLLAEVAVLEGEDFTVKDFFDRFYGAGVIPITLTRWEMTGEKDPVLDLRP